MGFASGARYLGRALHEPGKLPALCPTRIGAELDDPIGCLRIRAWVERSLITGRVSAAALFLEDAEREATTEAERLVTDLVRRAVSAVGLPLFELRRSELGRYLAIDAGTDAAIARQLAGEYATRFAKVRPAWTTRGRGSRSESARYWEMPIVALATALTVSKLAGAPERPRLFS